MPLPAESGCAMKKRTKQLDRCDEAVWELLDWTLHDDRYRKKVQRPSEAGKDPGESSEPKPEKKGMADYLKGQDAVP